MSRVVIGVDPHKASNTLVVIDELERVLAQQRFSNDRGGYRSMKTFARVHPDRVWAVEGARGVGAGLAQRLVAEGEPVLDVPARLSARVRALGGGSGRKTDDFASYTGTAPVDVSSGDNNRHRLNRGGNRRLNHALHIAAVVQYRMPGTGQDYYRGKRDQGKTHLEALRCLERRLSDAVYRHLVQDTAAASPGGQAGASLQSSATDLIPMASTSEQSLPGLDHDPTPVLAVAP